MATASALSAKSHPQYNGYVQFTEEEGFFCAEVMLFRRT